MKRVVIPRGVIDDLVGNVDDDVAIGARQHIGSRGDPVEAGSDNDQLAGSSQLLSPATRLSRRSLNALSVR